MTRVALPDTIHSPSRRKKTSLAKRNSFNQQQSQDMANQGNQEAAQAASDTGTAVAAGVAAALNPNPAIKIRDHLKRVLLISVVVTACAMHLPGCASELVGSGGDVPFRRR